jgi:hypothetical protein
MNGKGVVIGIIALVILFVLVIGFRGGDSDKSGTSNDSDQVAEVFSRSGKISSISSDRLEINSNGTFYTVLVDSKTEFIKRTIPKKIVPRAGKDFFKPEPISLSDLNVGDVASVVSNIDIGGRAEFRADQVQIVIVE